MKQEDVLIIEHESTKINYWIKKALKIKPKDFWPDNWIDIVNACVVDDVFDFNLCLNAHEFTRVLIGKSFIKVLFKVVLIHDSISCLGVVLQLAVELEIRLAERFGWGIKCVVEKYELAHFSIKFGVKNKDMIEYLLNVGEPTKMMISLARNLHSGNGHSNFIVVDVLLKYVINNMVALLEDGCHEVYTALNWIVVHGDWFVHSTNIYLCIIRLLLFNGANVQEMGNNRFLWYMLRHASWQNNGMPNNNGLQIKNSMESLVQNCY